MTRTGTLFALAALGGAMAAGSAAAGAEIYQYRIEHPLYGEIGSYTNIVERTGDGAVVKTKIHVAVKVLGITMHKEDAERTERWQNGRLISFQGVTDSNGKRIAVSGTAQAGKFVVSTPTGTVEAPASVRPTNPWSAKLFGAGALMSTKTGEVHPARVSGVTTEVVSVGGSTKRLTRYQLESNAKQSVWFNDEGVAVAFRTDEDGTAVDFVLAGYPRGKPDLWAGLPKENGAVIEPASLALGSGGARAPAAR
jgi:hypothetical protein